METERLEYFLKVAETGSFSAAAEALFTTQATVSKQIARLEKELDAQLFDRSHRMAVLTPRGSALIPAAQQLLVQCRSLRRTVAEEHSPLRLAVQPVVGYYGLMEKLACFGQEHPDVPLSIREFENVRVPDQLRDGSCDAAIWRADTSEPVPWRYAVLCTDELALVVRAGHPLAGAAQPVELSAFREERFILMGEGTLLYEEALSACRRAGFEPDILYTGSSAENVARLVGSGAGAALFMRQVALGLQDPSLQVLRFAPAVRSRILLAVSPDGEKRREVMQLWNALTAAPADC